MSSPIASAIARLHERFFSGNVLPYWCVVILDCVTLVLCGQLGVYLTLGGMVVIDDFWNYIYVWIFFLPIYLLMMMVFRTYGGIITKSLLLNITMLGIALFMGGIIMETVCLAIPYEVVPFQPAFRSIIVAICIAFVIQSFYRSVARRMIRVDSNGHFKAWSPFTSSKHGIYDNELADRKKINLCLAHMSEEGLERKYVKEAFDTNWVVPLGPNVNAFEKALEDFVNPEASVSSKVAALSAGTAAVHLALISLEVRPGDEVIVQSFTFCASSNPIVYMGAVPVFVDSEPETWNMDPELLEKAIVDRKKVTGRYPKAIIPVALYGMPYQIDRIMAIANRYGIPVIEDAAEGFGSRYKGRVLGTFGQYGVLSFNGNKMITTSGGGALVCNGKEEQEGVSMKNRILWYATQARDSYPYYQHTAIGFNYRMSNVCAGIGRGQMSVADAHIAHHRHIQSLYEEWLRDVPGVKVHKAPAVDFDSNYWLCTLTLDPAVEIKGQDQAYKTVVSGAVGGAAGVINHVDCPTTDCQPNENVEALRVFLNNAQIEARPLWKPMHRQPVYQYAPAYVNGVSESIFKIGLCLPSGPCVTDNDVRYIVDKIKESIIS